jgi:hypothetical protein
VYIRAIMSWRRWMSFADNTSIKASKR